MDWQEIVGLVTLAVVVLFLVVIFVDEWGRNRPEDTVYANRVRRNPENARLEKVWALQFWLAGAVTVIIILTIALVS